MRMTRLPDMADAIFDGYRVRLTQAGAGIQIDLNEHDTLSVQMGGINDCDNKCAVDDATEDFLQRHFRESTTVGKLLRQSTKTAEVGFIRDGHALHTIGYVTLPDLTTIMYNVAERGIGGYLPAPVMEDE